MFQQMTELAEQFAGAEQDSDIDVLCEFATGLAKFKIDGDDQEEEDPPEEVPEDENETEQIAEDE